MHLPFGDIKETRLTIHFSSADFSIASVLAAVKERSDMFTEMKVLFLGACTDIPAGPSPVFRAVDINAFFEYTGPGDSQPVLEKVYVQVWEAVALTFPGEPVWATAKGDFAKFISAQADLLRARIESSKAD